MTVSSQTSAPRFLASGASLRLEARLRRPALTAHALIRPTDPVRPVRWVRPAITV